MKTNSMMSIDDALDAKFNELVVSCMKSGAIDLNLYQEYDVKRGLRDSNGKGVLTGLTEISDVTGYRVVDGVKEPADGMLYYQGYDVKNLVGDGIDKRFAFEETTYLLLFGYLPNKEQLEVFHGIIAGLQELSCTSYKFYQRCYYEGAKCKSDERIAKKCLDFVLLRC